MEDNLLNGLGLTSQEIKLYKTVLKAQQISPSELAKALDIKRTTVYSMARGLVDKGLLVEDSTRRPRAFKVSGSEELTNAMENERSRSEQRLSLLRKLGEEVSKQKSKETYPVPQIRFIEEAKIENFLNQRIVEWNKSMEKMDPVFWGYQDPTFLEHYEPWIQKYWEFAPKNFEVKLLTNLASAEKEVEGKYERRYTKFWGEATNFISTTWVIGDYVVILNTRNHPFYLIEIHDKLMAHDQREIYRNLWELV